MKKTTLIAFAVAAAAIMAALAFPLSNLLVHKKPDAELLARFDDAETREMIGVYALKCMDCHSSSTKMPFYAGFPVAKSMIGDHIEAGRAHLDLDREMFDPAIGITEAVVAKMQFETANGSMPPASYTAMHWNARWSADDTRQQATWARHLRARKDGAADVDNPIYDRPIYPLKKVQGLDPARVALGEAMYHDVRLSGDNTISCASCHDLAKGGTDNEPVSTGVGGQKGGINSPTTFNAVYALAQFWDGRAADLAEQADGPPNNPIEMATSWEEILGKLRADEQVVADVEAAYGSLTAEAIMDAIATYEMTLVTTGDALDRYLAGDDDALTSEQKRGLDLLDAKGCTTCHAGAAMGGTSYELIGVHGDYLADRGNPTDADAGRFAVTGDERDRGRFKVPTLRNVALTEPYFHDGTVLTLDDAVRKMARYERGEDLTDDETAALVALLEALTGEIPSPPQDVWTPPEEDTNGSAAL